MGMISSPRSIPERITASLAGNCASCSVIKVAAPAGPANIKESAVNPAMAWFGSTGYLTLVKGNCCPLVSVVGNWA